MGWANGASAPPVKDRAAAARLASSGSGRLRDMPRRTQGECGSQSRRPGRRFSRDEDAASRTRQWPIPGLWEWRRARSASANKRPDGARDGPGWRAPNGNWCDRRRALRLMQLDQILGLAARAIQAVVDPLGRADIEAGDDEADVETEHRRLNTGDGAPFAIPGLCLVARLGIAAQNRQVLDGASRADVVSDLVDFSGERLGTGQTEDVVDAVVLAPRHRLRPRIVPVPPESNSRLLPSRAGVPYQASKMGTHLDAARRLAGPQDDRHRPARLRVIDVDRQGTAVGIISVGQTELP